jgi:hypothetical protein
VKKRPCGEMARLATGLWQPARSLCAPRGTAIAAAVTRRPCFQ